MDPISNAVPGPHTRQSLYAALDTYLDSLKLRDPAKIDWARRVRNTENNVALMVGDGMWNTIEGLGGYDLRFADPATGQVGWFGTLVEPHEESAFSLRLKVDDDGKLCEAEALVVRQLDSGIRFENQKFEDKPILNEIVEPSRRVPRERMLSLADGYFDTLQLNDGRIFTQFHPDCQRVENGVQTTNNPEFAKFVPVAGLPCEEQFRMGNYRYDDRLRARRFGFVDEERGLVWAAGFIDHAGKLGEYKLTDGTVVQSMVRRPHSFYLMELFKIQDGMIWQIEADFMTVPYFMPSPWDDWAKQGA